VDLTAEQQQKRLRMFGAILIHAGHAPRWELIAPKAKPKKEKKHGRQRQ
jgi:hypothetical protein